jgi:uncharacterized protein with PQ loop repeat
MSSADHVADGLGFLLGIGSLALYTPILVRVFRQGNAEGIALSTFWLKLTAYCCADIYSFARGYPLSTYIDPLSLTVEAALLLFTVAFLQRKLDASFVVAVLALVLACAWALVAAPMETLALASVASTVLNTGALVPQIALNARRSSSGDYSPLTAALACGGCTVRLFTTVRLSSSDPFLMAGFGSAVAVNSTLLAQIIWYSAIIEKRPWASLVYRDFEKGPVVAKSTSMSKP